MIIVVVIGIVVFKEYRWIIVFVFCKVGIRESKNLFGRCCYINWVEDIIVVIRGVDIVVYELIRAEVFVFCVVRVLEG